MPTTSSSILLQRPSRKAPKRPRSNSFVNMPYAHDLICVWSKTSLRIKVTSARNSTQTSNNSKIINSPSTTIIEHVGQILKLLHMASRRKCWLRMKSGVQNGKLS